MWSWVTCLALTLATTQSLEHRALEDFQSHRRRMIATENKKEKKTKKHYTKHYLTSEETVPKDAIRRYECVSTRIT
jgi:hypothetical protein